MVFEKVMNYNCSYELLGNYIQDGEFVQTAGIIDKKLMVVKIGKEFPAEIQNLKQPMNLGMQFYIDNLFYIGIGQLILLILFQSQLKKVKLISLQLFS